MASVRPLGLRVITKALQQLFELGARSLQNLIVEKSTVTLVERMLESGARLSY